MTTQIKNIGVPNVVAPKQVPKDHAYDRSCPYTGELTVHGRQFVGTVINAKVPKLAVVEFERRVFLQKYQRYLKKRTKLRVHNPAIINAKVGDVVRIMECRPISKTKNFVILEVLGKEELIEDILEARERAADKKKDKKAAEAPKEAKEEAAEETE